MRLPFIAIVMLLGMGAVAQVNTRTGAAEQSFPLINFSDLKSGLTMGVSAVYSGGSGIMVNDVATSLGTGWSLDAGGLVARVQTGEPDDQQEYLATSSLTGDNVLKNYPAGYLYNTHVGDGCAVGLNYYTVFKQKNTLYKPLPFDMADTEQDKFVFRMNGRAGTFVIGRDMKAYSLGDTRTKIEFSVQDMTGQGIRTRINQFTITTEDGIKYKFDIKGLNRLVRYKYSRYNKTQAKWEVIQGDPANGWLDVNRFWGYELADNERPFVVNNWFLSEIENTNTGAKISFEYEQIAHDVISAKYLSQQRDLNNTGKVGGTASQNSNGNYYFTQLLNPATANRYVWDETVLSRLDAGPTSLTYVRAIARTQRLKKVILPNGGEIRVSYNQRERADLKGDHAIDKVEYVLNQSTIRAFEFEYGYFFKNTIKPYTYGFNGLEEKYARLCLLSIRKTGTGSDNASEPPYRFTYYTGSNFSADDIVPARNSLSQDHWGYYNGSNSMLSLTEDHDFLSDEKNQYYKAVLPQLHNPKKGYARNGLLRSVTFPTGGSLEYTYEQNRLPSSFIPRQTEPLAGGVSVSKTTYYDALDHAKDIITEYSYVLYNGVSSKWGDELPVYHSYSYTRYDEKGLNKRFRYPGIQYPEMASEVQKMDLTAVFARMILNMAIQEGIKLIFAGTMVVPIVNAIMIVVTITQYVIQANTTFDFYRFILSNANVIASNPLGTYFSRVELRTNSPGGYNGKTVMEYTSPADYPLISPKYEWPYLPNQRMASWAYGLLKTVTVYDKNDVIVSEKENKYTFYLEKIADQYNQSLKCATMKTISKQENLWEDGANSPWFTWDNHEWMTPRPYFYYTGRADLHSINERAYVNGQLYMNNTANIINDPATLVQKGKYMIGEDYFSVLVNMTYYPKDFNLTGAIQTLKDRNALHTPVSTETWLLKKRINQIPSSTSRELISASVTEFAQYTFNGRTEVRPWKTWTLKTNKPISVANIGFHDPSQLIRAPQYYRLESEMSYDSEGNMIQTTADQLKTSYIYDHASRYVVATAVNAAHSDIAYASFEADGKGSWSYSSHFTTKINSLTGRKGYILAGTTLDPNDNNSSITRADLNGDLEYVVTYWKKDIGAGTVTVNGGSGELLYERADGWKLYRHELSGVTSVAIDGDNVHIDELRLYPKGAMMSTACFQEGFGKITECDANNRLLYYEYDALGRLKLMRDQDRNVIKTYEYNFKH